MGYNLQKRTQNASERARTHTHTRTESDGYKKGERESVDTKKKQYFMFLEGMLRRVRVLVETDLRSHIRSTPQTKNIIICIYVELVLNMLLSILVFFFVCGWGRRGGAGKKGSQFSCLFFLFLLQFPYIQ